MADDDRKPGEKYDAEPLNKVTEKSYTRDHRGPYPFGGAELASDGPVVEESTVSVTAVPGSPAAEGVFAGLQGDAMQKDEGAPADGEDNTGQDQLKSSKRKH